MADRSSREANGPGVADLVRISDREFRDLRELILDATGINLTEAKRQLLCARLSRRLRALGLGSFGAYYDHLRGPDGSAEQVQMINCITTNKTDFFREAHHFDMLRDLVVEPARTRRTLPRRLRIWSACCSTGEEPWSIAMTIADAIRGERGWDVRVIASDIDTAVLSHAERAVYDESRLATIPRERWGRYFLRGKGASSGWYQIRPELRAMVEFKRINLVEPSWGIAGPLDAIFCRNALIYFATDLQQRTVEGFVRRLAADGLLFVGHSESLYWARSILQSVRNTVYRPIAALEEDRCT